MNIEKQLNEIFEGWDGEQVPTDLILSLLQQHAVEFAEWLFENTTATAKGLYWYRDKILTTSDLHKIFTDKNKGK